MTKMPGSLASARRWVLVAGACAALLCSCSGPAATGASKSSRSSQPPSDFETQRDQPPSAKTLYSMAGILAAQGKDSECEFILRRCLREHPRFTPAYNRLAELQMRQGRVNEAAEVLSEALRLRPEDPVLANNLGMCWLVRKEYAKALEQFTKAAGIVPESQKYRANMATVLGLLGRQEESLALLQQVLPADQARHNADVLRKAYEEQTGPPANIQG
jgi:Flp pilus assembly protein TadD